VGEERVFILGIGVGLADGAGADAPNGHSGAVKAVTGAARPDGVIHRYPPRRQDSIIFRPSVPK
jgi:hypothetical protein